jgi:hypothetical protein
MVETLRMRELLAAQFMRPSCSPFTLRNPSAGTALAGHGFDPPHDI